MRLVRRVSQPRQRCTIAHSPSCLTAMAMGSIGSRQGQRRSPGSSSTWRDQRHDGQWLRCLVPHADCETRAEQVMQVKSESDCDLRDIGLWFPEAGGCRLAMCAAQRGPSKVGERCRVRSLGRWCAVAPARNACERQLRPGTLRWEEMSRGCATAHARWRLAMWKGKQPRGVQRRQTEHQTLGRAFRSGSCEAPQAAVRACCLRQWQT